MAKFGRLKKTVLMAASVLACAPFALVGCGGNPPAAEPRTTLNVIDDNARTYYEIFVASFADSDGNGMGDLRGLINNLDYLNDGNDATTDDLGINGLWLMPINPSPSYHKYNVIDYKNIDSSYGTLSDFDALITECNERGIWVQIDLVLNHSSRQNAWFQKAVEMLGYGYEGYDSSNPDTKYIEYYNFSKTRLNSNYRRLNSTWYYEASFDDDMPDLNMDCAALREEILGIADFWIERGVHGFRLDAAKHVYETSSGSEVVPDIEKNLEFWTWFNNHCFEKGVEVFGEEGETYDSENATNRYVYNVGEVLDHSSSSVANYFASNMSVFSYGLAGKNDMPFISYARGNDTADTIPDNVALFQRLFTAKDSHGVASNFLTNHDNDRLASMVQGNVRSMKIAASALLLYPGSAYIYYGEEIGMQGSGRDENKRLHMEWGDASIECNDPSGTDWRGGQPQGTVASQKNDTNSLLSYYRDCIRLRNLYPEIAHGRLTDLYVGSQNSDIGAYTLTYGDSTIVVVHNASTEEIEYTMPTAYADYVLGNYVGIDGNTAPTIKDGKVNMPGGVSAIFVKKA